jgi:hypothetical protein
VLPLLLLLLLLLLALVLAEAAEEGVASDAGTRAVPELVLVLEVVPLALAEAEAEEAAAAAAAAASAEGRGGGGAGLGLYGFFLTRLRSSCKPSSRNSSSSCESCWRYPAPATTTTPTNNQQPTLFDVYTKTPTLKHATSTQNKPKTNEQANNNKQTQNRTHKLSCKFADSHFEFAGRHRTLFAAPHRVHERAVRTGQRAARPQRVGRVQLSQVSGGKKVRRQRLCGAQALQSRVHKTAAHRASRQREVK